MIILPSAIAAALIVIVLELRKVSTSICANIGGTHNQRHSRLRGFALAADCPQATS
jgi:Flp pilus assembly protein protease CpaA